MEFDFHGRRVTDVPSFDDDTIAFPEIFDPGIRQSFPGVIDCMGPLERHGLYEDLKDPRILNQICFEKGVRHQLTESSRISRFLQPNVDFPGFKPFQSTEPIPVREGPVSRSSLNPDRPQSRPAIDRHRRISRTPPVMEIWAFWA
jgi:hypothetical protein